MGLSLLVFLHHGFVNNRGRVIEAIGHASPIRKLSCPLTKIIYGWSIVASRTRSTDHIVYATFTLCHPPNMQYFKKRSKIRIFT